MFIREPLCHGPSLVPGSQSLSKLALGRSQSPKKQNENRHVVLEIK